MGKSDKCDCECNCKDHSHVFIWFVLFLVCIDSQCVDCSGEKTQLKQDVKNLESRIQQLEARSK